MILPASHILFAALRPFYRRLSALSLDELLSALTDSRFSRRLGRGRSLPVGIDLSGFDGRRIVWRRCSVGKLNGWFSRL